jgi:hypothetical protein
MSKRAYDILRDYRATGNKAIDAVASCIMWHRQRKIALKAIHLKEHYYDWFRTGVEVLQGKRLEDGQLMQFDGVDIEKGSRFQREAILPEVWTSEN